MTRTRTILTVLALLTVAGCGPQSVPPALRYATLFGQVYDVSTRKPVSGATVIVNGVQSAISDASGQYKIPDLPNGPVDWYASAPSYTSAQSSVTLTPGENRQLDIPMSHL